jgi:phosphoglucosamine mutase
MQEKDLSLGGEQSGHIIMRKYATTGDGILTAIMLAEELCDTKRTLSELCEGVNLYPQYIKNIKVRDKDAVLEDDGVQVAVKDVMEKIGERGRVLLRKSGTESVIRIMIECESEEKSREYAELIATAIKKGGHCSE